MSTGRSTTKTSPLSPLPWPSRRPGEGNDSQALERVGCAMRTTDVFGAQSAPYRLHRLSQVPLSRPVGGPWERGQR